MEQSGEALPVYGCNPLEIPLSSRDALVSLIGHSRKNKYWVSHQN